MSDPPKLPPAGSDPVPWLAWDERADFEDCLSGNREGLLALRAAIDAALERGQAPLAPPRTFFAVAGVLRVEGDPRATLAPTKPTVGSCFLGLLSALLGVFLLGGGAVLLVVACRVAVRYLGHLLTGNP